MDWSFFDRLFGTHFNGTHSLQSDWWASDSNQANLVPFHFGVNNSFNNAFRVTDLRKTLAKACVLLISSIWAGYKVASLPCRKGNKTKQLRFDFGSRMNRCTVNLWSHRKLAPTFRVTLILLNPVNLASFLPEIDAKTKHDDVCKRADAII